MDADANIASGFHVTWIFGVKVLGIINDSLDPSNSKIYEKEPRYNGQILPVPWPFVISRFHCTFKLVMRSEWSAVLAPPQSNLR